MIETSDVVNANWFSITTEHARFESFVTDAENRRASSTFSSLMSILDSVFFTGGRLLRYRSQIDSYFLSGGTMKIQSLVLLALCFCQLTVSAQNVDGLGLVDSSFANEVIRYDPRAGGGDAPVETHYLDPKVALGGPSSRWVSLGSGGVIELAFVDNVLTNSRDKKADLYIGEVYGAAERFHLALRPSAQSAALLRGKLSADGYIEIGSFTGEWRNDHFVALIDIDQALPDLNLSFDAVRITDDPDEGKNDVKRSPTVGLDLTSVGALSSSASYRGDLNGDTKLDAADIDALAAAIRDGNRDPRFDLNRDGTVDWKDQEYWVHDIKKTYFGDANLDGEFNSRDFVLVFSAGEYEDRVPGNSTWEEGDWNGDGEFSSSDFVTAWQSAGYDAGPRTEEMER